MTELKRCPFCGGEATKKTVQTPFQHGWVGCAKCKAYMQWQYDPSGTITKWNRRVSDGD